MALESEDPIQTAMRTKKRLDRYQEEEFNRNMRELDERMGGEREPPCCSSNICDYFPKRSRYEPVNLPFDEMAAKRHNCLYSELTRKEQVELIRTELTPKIILIDPQSLFMRRWDMIMFVALSVLMHFLLHTNMDLLPVDRLT